MKAVYLDGTGAESLRFGEIEKPEPEPDEVLVKVYATALTPTELHWFPTSHDSSGAPRPFPIVLSHEFAGVVEGLGPRVRNWKIGDAVYGLNDWFSNGAQAEYVTAPATSLAPKPKSIDHIHAAVTPISALTAWQGLLEKAQVRRGQRVLIHGGAGGVGSFAVQLAHWKGAKVIATASSGNIEFVQSLGADEVINYERERFEDMVDGVDVVFDTVGGDALERSWRVMADNGRLVTVASQNQQDSNPRSRDAFMLVRADGSQLSEIATFIDAGVLQVFAAEVFPLELARDAYTRARQGKMRGKIALSAFAESANP